MSPENEQWFGEWHEFFQVKGFILADEEAILDGKVLSLLSRNSEEYFMIYEKYSKLTDSFMSKLL